MLNKLNLLCSRNVMTHAGYFCLISHICSPEHGTGNTNVLFLQLAKLASYMFFQAKNNLKP